MIMELLIFVIILLKEDTNNLIYKKIRIDTKNQTKIQINDG